LNELSQSELIYHAQKQTSYRPDENATYWSRLDNGDTSPAYDANDRKKDEDGVTRSKTNEDGSRQGREGENIAAQLFAETAGSFEGLVSGIDFPIQSAKVRQPFHGQAMFVLFAIDKQFHQMLGKPFAARFVSERFARAPYMRSARSTGLQVGKAQCPGSFRKNNLH
jgi:hypothetical protein